MSPADLRVVVDVDCGNAPRKAQVRDWLLAIARADVDTACAALHDQVRWEFAAGPTHEGTDEVRSLIERMAAEPPSTIRLRNILSHGKQVCAEGATDTHRFVHIVTYSGHGKSATIQHVITYKLEDPAS